MTVAAVIIHQLVSTCSLVWLCPWVCLAPGLQDHSSLSSSEGSQGQGHTHGLPALVAPGIEGAGKATEEGDALGGLWWLLRGLRDLQAGGGWWWCLRPSRPPITLVESEGIKVSRELCVSKMCICRPRANSPGDGAWGPRRCRGSCRV